MSILSLIRDAITTEIRNWRNPPPAGAPPSSDEAPVVDQPADSVVDRRWQSPTFHLEQLAAEVCLCGAPKKKHSYQCLACRQVSK